MILMRSDSYIKELCNKLRVLVLFRDKVRLACFLAPGIWGFPYALISYTINALPCLT